MEDWSWRPSDRNECRFCGASNGWPSVERHWEHCPRLLWAVASRETPREKVERRTGESYPNWGPDTQALKFYRWPYLYNSAPKVLEVLASVDPATYGEAWLAYCKRKAEFDKSKEQGKLTK